MTNCTRVASVLAVLAMLSVPVVRGQQPAPDGGQKAATARPSLALQLQFVLSKYHNDKKISGRPYTVIVSGPDVAKGTLKVGSEVPVPMSLVGPSKPDASASGGSPPPRMFNYRSIGTTIICSVQPLDGGQYRLDVSIDDSSIQKNADTTIDAPVFQSFSIRGGPVMKDGQTTQLSSSTDPVSGEVMRVDVTLTVVK